MNIICSHRIARCERGNFLVLTAAGLSMLLTLGGFLFSVGLAYDTRNQIAAAADAAARAGAWEILRQGDALTDDALTAFASRAIQYKSDASTWVSSTTLTVRRCNNASATCTSPYNTKTYVEAIVSKTTPAFLGGFLASSSLTPTARGVAGFAPGKYCLITLAGVGATPTSLVVGNTTLSMPNCAVGDAGDINGTNPNATITASTIGVTATSCTGSCSSFTPLSLSQPAPVDPLSGLMPPIPTLNGCGTAPSNGTFGGGGQCYRSMSIGTNKTVTLNAGTTYFTGAITFGNNSTLTAPSGSTIVLANGASITTGNSSTINIVAPTSGSYSGIAIYQPATNTNADSFQNSPVFNVTGATYMPAADVSFRNGFTSSSDCVLMVVKSLSIDNGNGSFANGCSEFGGSPVSTIALAE